MVEKTGRGAATARPMCARPPSREALERGIAEFGKVDIVVAQAGIAGMKGELPLQAWVDAIPPT